MIIRKATKKDALGIAKILQKYFGKDYRPFKFTKALIEEKISDGKNKFFVAIEVKNIIGAVRTSQEDIDLVELRWFAVDKKFRSRNIGKTLLQYTLKFLKKQKMRKVIARAVSDNKTALRLFKSLGFSKEGYFKEHFRKGTDIIQTSKFL